MGDIKVPAKLSNILLKYNSSRDLSFEKFLITVIDKDGVDPVIDVLDIAATRNIQSIINKVNKDGSLEERPSDFCEVKESSSQNDEEVELI